MSAEVAEHLASRLSKVEEQRDALAKLLGEIATHVVGEHDITRGGGPNWAMEFSNQFGPRIEAVLMAVARCASGAEADARLIAAVPDLLAALVFLEGRLGRHDSGCAADHGKSGACSCGISDARAAIAKAGGA